MKIEMSYNEIDNAEHSDIGRVALMTLGGPTLAIEDTLAECIATAQKLEMTVTVVDDDGNKTDRLITADDVDTRTDRRYLNSNSLVAVDIVEQD